MNIAMHPHVDPNPLNVIPGLYDIDPKHTRVLFHVSHFGFSRYWGEFVDPEGFLHIDPRDLSATMLAVSLPVSKVMTNSTLLDDELTGPDWFDVERYPTIDVVSRGVRQTAGRRAKIDIDLTIRDVTAPIELDAYFNASGQNPLHQTYTIGFEATASIQRSVFGVSAAIPLISDEVQLVISASLNIR